MSRPSTALPSSEDQLYEVFGRLNCEDVLAHVGSIQAPNPELAIVRARTLCGHRYRELCLAQTSAFIRATTGDDVAVKEF